jgi:hypothetical protein
MAIYTATTIVAPHRRTQQLLQALGLAAVVVIVEYLARHFVLFWLPALGALSVNDMLAAVMFYIAATLLTLVASGGQA